MPPRCARGPRPQGPLFWDRKPLLSPYRASRAGRSAHRTLAPSPSCAAQRIQDSGPRGRNFRPSSEAMLRSTEWGEIVGGAGFRGGGWVR